MNRGRRSLIVGSPGGPLPVVEGGGGFVERLERKASQLTGAGWSASRAGAASAVLVFRGRELVASARPTGERPDVAQNLGPRALRSGFSIDAFMPGRWNTRSIKVFGVIRGRAFELPRLQGG